MTTVTKRTLNLLLRWLKRLRPSPIYRVRWLDEEFRIAVRLTYPEIEEEMTNWEGRRKDRPSDPKWFREWGSKWHYRQFERALWDRDLYAIGKFEIVRVGWSWPG